MGCSFGGPPYEVREAVVQAQRGPSVRGVEGQPRGLLLEVSLEAGAPPPEAVLLLRQAEEGPFDLRFRFEPDKQAALWEAGRVSFLDAGLAVGEEYGYAVVLVREGKQAERSGVWRVRWAEPPAPPQGLEAEALGRHVRLRWELEAGLGVVLFRREVGGEGGGRYERLGEALPVGLGSYVDEVPRAGGVYVYVASSVRWGDGGLAQVGAPSEEVYVGTRP